MLKWVRLFAVILPLFSCVQKMSSQDVAQSVRDAETVLVLGEVSSMTGVDASYGLSAHQGIVLAINQANQQGGVQGRKIKLVTIDSQGKAEESAQAITQLISRQKVKVIITGVISSNALAMAPIAQKKKISMISTISTHPKVTQVGDAIFRICLMDTFQGKIMAQFSLDHLKLKNAAILRDLKSDYSLGLSESFSSVFQQGGGTLLINQTYSSGDIDFRSQLTVIRSKKPDFIYVPGYYADVALIARQAREMGIRVPLLGGDGWDSPKLKEMGGEALSGSYFSSSYFPTMNSPLLKKFMTDFKEAYGFLPDGLAVTGYEGAQYLVEALKQAKGFDSENIRLALLNLKGFQSVTGELSLDSDRNAIRSAVVLKISSNGSLDHVTTLR